MKLLEKDMEDLILNDPERYLGESGLKIISRQYAIGNYRFDLLFHDRHGGKLIVEIQRGTLDRNHTYKILDYYDEYKKKNPHEFIDLMIIANKITRERRHRLESYGISFLEIPESVFLQDKNFSISRNQKLNSRYEQINTESAKENFLKAIKIKQWFNECAKIDKITDHRKSQIESILNQYNGIKVPYTHFTKEKLNDSKLRNREIFPIICAFHAGYFIEKNDHLILKKEVIDEFKIKYKIYSTQVTILEKIKSLFHSYTGEVYKRNEIIAIVIEKYPGTNPTSIIPSDYCYNIINKAPFSFSTHLFEFLGAGSYKCLGEKYPYNGDIHWKGEKVGHWKNGKPILIKDPRINNG